MKQFEIKNYNSSYHDKLYNYLKIIAYNSSESYVEYCVNTSDGKMPSILVVDENDNIVGCHLHFSTQMNVKGEIKDVAWGHETYLNEDYRSSAGLDFVLTINCKNSIGIGLSETNRKIQKKIKKNVMMSTVYSYCFLNVFFPYGVIYKCFMSKIKPLKLENVIYSKVVFRQAKSPEDIVIPNGGFWFENRADYDLIRDREYLNRRFFNNKVFEYSVYEYHNEKGDSCYFVIRPILFRGVPTVSLVDYRFYGNSNLMNYILLAVRKIAMKNHIGIVQTIGGIKEVNSTFESLFCVKRLAECLIHKTLGAKPTDSISITPSDSDVDFNR